MTILEKFKVFDDALRALCKDHAVSMHFGCGCCGTSLHIGDEPVFAGGDMPAFWNGPGVFVEGQDSFVASLVGRS